MKRVLVLLVALFVMGVIALNAQTRTPIYVYIDSDTNISDWWRDFIKPRFEAEFPQFEIVITLVRGVGGGNGDMAMRALAALETNSDPQVDFLEVINVQGNPQWVEADLFYAPTEEEVPNLVNLGPSIDRLPQELPYRGSQVLLAYNSEFVAEEDVPTTYAELIEWIKANPGQFIYNRPDRGGSGAAMVTRAIFEVTGQDPTQFRSGEAREDLIEQFPKAWELLSSIHPFVYEGGGYPAGNTPVLELFANGSVNMITAWSDQALQAINLGLLPEGTRLTQLQDLPFTGGYATSAIPRNASNLEGALALANFLLTEEVQTSVVRTVGGFPAVNWELLPTELQEDFTSVITDTVPTWPGGAYSAAMVEGWYNNVATNVQR